jgi:hypothetical protein
LLFTFARLLPAPVQAPRTCSPLPRKERPHRPTLRLLDVPRGPPRRRREDASHRLLQPTLRHAHPTIAQLPSSRLSPQRPPPHSASGQPVLKAPNTCGSAAPDHLSAIQPRVARRLTPSHKLRSALFTRLLTRCFVEEGTGPVSRAASPRRFQPPSKLTTRPLTLPVAPRRRPDEPNGKTKSQDRFYRPCVNKSGFPGPKRLSSTRAPPTFAGSARHRSRSFAAAIRLPALVRLPDALAREG